MKDSIRKFLVNDGYDIQWARDEFEAEKIIRKRAPHLILLTLEGSRRWLLPLARDIREKSGLTEWTPIVIFSLAALAECGEERLSDNLYISAPENFGELRGLLRRILRGISDTD